MPIVTAPQEFNTDDLFVDLSPICGRTLHLKCEGFNFAGSIKLRAARSMVAAVEKEGLLDGSAVLVESSSGNLGVALSMVAANRGHRFLCVTDTRCNLATRRLMETLGAEVHVVTESGPRGFLGARLEYIKTLCASSDRYVWLNQYANRNNWLAHYQETAPAIAREFPDLDVLFVPAGTTGTLMGCARYFRQWSRPVTVIAVDSVGSVTFGDPPGPRMIPGVGTSVRPPMLNWSYVDDRVLVAERDTVRMCHHLARSGFVFGGSTGTVVHGALSWLDEHGRDSSAVAIAPDLGERYLDTIYQSNWLDDIYGPDILTEALVGVPESHSSSLTAAARREATPDTGQPNDPHKEVHHDQSVR